MCRLFFLYSVVIFNSKLDHWLPVKKAVVKALSTHIPMFLKTKDFSSFLKNTHPRVAPYSNNYCFHPSTQKFQYDGNTTASLTEHAQC